MIRSVIFLLVLIAIAVNGRVIKSSSFALEGRISGGEATNIENHPHMVSIRLVNIHFCGGSIISYRTIVTGAHCLEPSLPSSLYSVQYGTSAIGGMNNVIIAESILRHENYNATNFNNDIGLLILISKIPFDAGVSPIQLASKAPAAGVSAVITGWGYLDENGPYASILQKAVVKIISRSDCQAKYKGINKITLSMLCAGIDGGGIDACKFDSGGPLVIDGRLAGVISYGNGCGNPDYPGVYSNIETLKNWVEENMSKQGN